jgi:RNA polymerase sigma-70 factor (ECF subfamily)
MADSAQLAPATHPLFRALYLKSGAAAYELGEAEFAQILNEIAAKYLPDAAADDHARFCEFLRVEELALARACAAGNDKAWEVFLTRYRAKLFEMSFGIARSESAAKELADSLYADLYGTRTREGRRVSKLSYYMGRGSLEGWLRTVLAQQYVDHFRRQKRLVSLEEQEERGTQFASASPGPAAVDPEPRLAPAIDEVLAALGAEERFVLSSYFLDGRTLVDIARILKVHESTISRKVDRITRQVRAGIIKKMMERGVDRRAAEEALAADVRDIAANVRASLGSHAPGIQPSSAHSAPKKLVQELGTRTFHGEDSGGT